MSAATQRARRAWDDRFHTPSAGDLVSAVEKQWRTAFSHARECILRDADVSEVVAWQGVWKWTLTYRHVFFPERAWAYLIADPAKPRLCVPMSDVAIDGLNVAKTPKFVRESLAFAPIVDGVRWPVWDVQTRQLINGILGLLDAKTGCAAGAAR
ncbi:MAG: hypothetical protein JNK25_15355 [Phycisphaerae bacterium]|nr:hypothetical protein [Phycisphaerae bacterium]